VVHEGKQFWIKCRAEKPIKWYKDGEPIETGFIRQGDEEFTYSTRINERDDLKGKVESTLNVSHAVLRHRGKYQCNINHESAHILHVSELPVSQTDDTEHNIKNIGTFETNDDHEESLEEDRPAASTMMHSSDVTHSYKSVVRNESPENSHDSDDAEDYKNEEFSTKSSETTSETVLPVLSFTNSPIPTTHETIQFNNAIQPSEGKKQDHLDKHPKGSQNTRKKIKE
jgi:hypothetical protein